jgi:hypothetical protein
MSMPISAANVFDREFLGIRCRLIELAAALDRIDRAENTQTTDPRGQQIRRSLEILASDASNRAEQVLIEFSLPPEEGLGQRTTNN